MDAVKITNQNYRQYDRKKNKNTIPFNSEFYNTLVDDVLTIEANVAALGGGAVDISDARPQYITFLGDTFRIGVRGGAFRIDQTITPLGFDGIEDTDWECLQTYVRE
jgi:hypothetical protein